MANALGNVHTVVTPASSCYASPLYLQRACEVVQGYWRLTVAAVGLTSLYLFGTPNIRETSVSSVYDVLQTASVTLVAYPVHSIAVVAVGLIFVPVQVCRNGESVLVRWGSKRLFCIVLSRQPKSIACSSTSAFQSHRIQLEGECSSPVFSLVQWLRPSVWQNQEIVQHYQLGRSDARDASAVGSHMVVLSPRAWAVDDIVAPSVSDPMLLSTAPSIRAWLRFLGHGQDKSVPSSSPSPEDHALPLTQQDEQQITHDSSPVSSPVSTSDVDSSEDLMQVVSDELLSQFQELVNAPNFSQLNLPSSSAAWSSPAALFGGPENKHVHSGWERMVQQSSPGFSLTSCRRPMRHGLFLYCSRAVFEDATPAQVRSFYMDDQYKVSCDKSLLEWITLPPSRSSSNMSEAPALGAENGFLFSRIDFPGPLAAREYTYARRVWDRSEDNGCYCINKSCTHSATPKPKGMCVNDYSSGYVIRSCAPASSNGRQATELIIIYFEDSKVRAPGILNMAIKNGMWGSWQRMEGWFRDHVQMHIKRDSAASVVPFPLRLKDIKDSAVQPFPLQLLDSTDEEDEEAERDGKMLDVYQAQLRPLRIPASHLLHPDSHSPAPPSSTSIPFSDHTTFSCRSSQLHQDPFFTGDMNEADDESSHNEVDEDDDTDDAATQYSDASSDIAMLQHDDTFHPFRFQNHHQLAAAYGSLHRSAIMYGNGVVLPSFPVGVRAPVPSEWLPLLNAGATWHDAGASSVGRVKRTLTKVFTLLRGDRYKRRRRWASLRRQVVKVAKFAAGVKIMEAVLTVKGSMEA